MNLGFDVDGVMTDVESYVLEYGAKYSKENNLSIEKLNVEQYMTNDIFGWDEDKSEEFWTSILNDYAENERPRFFVSEVIHKLKEQGHKIHIITARESMTEEDKRDKRIEKVLINWLKKHDIYCDKLIFTGSSKIEAIKSNNIDLMVDDMPKNIKEISKYCETIIFDANYNKNVNIPNTKRVYSWYEILDYIEKINMV